MTTDLPIGFHWRAEFTDGTIVKQYDDDGTPHKFQEVQDREDSLVYFWLELMDAPNTTVIGVDLTDGSFNINDFVINPLKDDEPWAAFGPEFRVINFRRVRKHMNTLGEQWEDMDYFIGWQTTHQGKNYKKLMKIGFDGTFSMS